MYLVKKITKYIRACFKINNVRDVVAESQLTEEVADIPMFNRIRELNKRDLMAVYHCLQQNN